MADTLTAALTEFEAAWPSSLRGGSGRDGIIAFDAVVAVNALWSALRAIRESGGSVCVLSRESIEALHDTRLACLASSTFRVSMEPGSALDLLMTALDRDLADVLKETTNG